MTRKIKNLSEEVSKYINSGIPGLFFYTYEERIVISFIKQLAEKYEREALFCYNPSDGLVSLQEPIEELEYSPRTDIRDALKFLNNFRRPFFVIFQDVHLYLKDKPEILRGFKNLFSSIVNEEIYGTVFFISPVLDIPMELEKDIVVIDFPLPDKEEIEVIIESFRKQYNLFLREPLKTRFIDAFNGLTREEIKYLLAYSIVDDAELTETDIENIMIFKKQIIKKIGLVELVKVTEKPEHIGGLKTLKEWLDRKQKIYKNLELAQKAGVDIPKGVLLVGMPGCGKSLTAKACASIFSLPLLRLDMGAVFGPYLGQSEENIRRVIKLTESIAPCILWIDEIEKGFAGVRGEGSSSEVITRIFGTILTWMQEKTSPVFVVATSNDISLFPPEFLRKGRFDEIFFVDYPDAEVLRDIINIHFRKRGWNIKLDEEKLLTLCSKLAKRNFSGADAEALVVETIESIFFEKLQNGLDAHDIKETVNGDEIIKTLEKKSSEIKPIGEAKKEYIEKIREIFNKYAFKNAN